MSELLAKIINSVSLENLILLKLVCKSWNDIVDQYHTHGCDWDKYACKFAVHTGNLDCLEYAITNGCSYDEFTCKQGCLEARVWMKDKGYYEVLLKLNNDR